MKLVIVRWEDAAMEDGQIPSHAVETKSIWCKTVGWLISETDECVSLAMEENEFEGESEWRHIKHIPRSCIDYIEELEFA